MVCKPEDSMDWYEKMWRYSVELFRSLDIPVRQLECCSGDGVHVGLGHDALHHVAVDHEGGDAEGEALADHEVPGVGQHRLVESWTAGTGTP